MKDSPLIISLLIGLIVVLVIAGVSILVKMNSLSGEYKKQLAKNISCEKTTDDLNKDIETLQGENSKLKEDLALVNIQVESLGQENAKLEKLKEKLEDNLKEELMKPKTGNR
ncbi:MAG: hypothetical protein KKH93_01410 [Candidatus Omnitrophica bacterium]|nr:hypothetical protein [Candidatus Omnitrophota bacterium]MBU2044891.1 hypothetical protein [Candidatus Omnitrophota bacterium]MBU2250949.1 hypothetical protein [Candidatus Omnitrophota bacterium]MBU2266093.1 hypothetical protein [Candidatus Omnitrophota bacterium]